MVWPTRAMSREGFKEFKSPVENVKGHGPHDWEKGWRAHTGQVYDAADEYEKEARLPEDAKELGIPAMGAPGFHYGVNQLLGLDDDDEVDYAERREESGLSYWGIKNNPLFEHAAKAKGIDWNAFINTYADIASYETLRTDAAIRWNDDTMAFRGASKEVRSHGREGQTSTRTVEIQTPAPHDERYGLDQRVAGSEELMRQIYNMNKFIYDSVKDWEEEYDAPLIEAGPTSEQYGLPKGTDPWEFYGLDKVPRIIPKALDVDYELNLNDPFASGAKYNTPKGYPGIDLSAVEPAKPGKSFTDYVKDYEFAQEHGYWDFDLGNTGDANYQKELQFIFGDAAKDVRIFGQMDYDSLIEQGLDKDEVIDIINARVASGQKLILGPAIAKHLDTYSYDPRWWGQPADTVGQKGVRLLQLQGLDELGIMNRYAKGKHGSKIGPWVQEHFGIRVWPETGMYDYFFMDPGNQEKAFGMQDYYQLEGQGMDPDRIKLIAQELTSAGWTLGPEAAKKLGLGDYQPQYQIAMQDGHLGGQVVDALMTQGQSIEDVRAYGENPEVLTIGSAAAEKLYGWTDKGTLGTFGMPDITENWPDGNAPSGVILSKIAAGNSSAIGADAVDYIWGHDLRDLHMKPPVGADPGHLTFGMDAINYLRTNHPAASSNKILKAIAKGAHWVGEDAAKELGIPANKPPIIEKTLEQVLSTPMSEYDKPDLIGGELGGFGQQEIDWMETAKWTRDQMRDVTDKFDRIGPEAAKYLWGEKLTSMMPAPANAVDPSKTTFGMEAIKYLDAADPQISDKSIAAVARGDLADYVGAAALEWFAERDIDVGKGSAPLKAAPAPTPVILPEVSAPPAPIPVPVPAPTPAPEPPAPEPPAPEPPAPEPPQRQPYVEQGNRNHFESSDLNYMRDRGYTRAEIRKVAESQGQIGTAAAQWIYDWSPRGGNFGKDDYDTLKRKGASETTIKNIAKNQSNIGAKMAEHFWGYTDPGNAKGWFGQADYDQLKGRGASEHVMRAIIRGMGLQTGNKFKHLG